VLTLSNESVAIAPIHSEEDKSPVISEVNNLLINLKGVSYM
jgi:hypothetical protein